MRNKLRKSDRRIFNIKKTVLFLTLALLLFGMHAQARALDLNAASVQSAPLSFLDLAELLPPTLETLDEVKDFIWECYAQRRERAVFYYGEALDYDKHYEEELIEAVYSSGVRGRINLAHTPSARRVELSELKYYPNSFRVRTMEEAKAAMAACRADELETATFYFSEELYHQLRASNFRELHLLEREAAISDPNMGYTDLYHRVDYPNVRYWEWPSPTLESLDEVEDFIWECYTQGRESALFYYIGALDLFTNIQALDNAIYSSGVKTLSSRHINPFACRVELSGLTYHLNSVRCATLQDVIRAFTACADTLSDSMTLYLTEELYETLTADKLAMLISLRKDCGMGFMKFTSNDARLFVRCHDITYYPGHRVLRAVRNGVTQELLDRERQLLRTAEGIVSQARARSATALELETALFDAVCANVEYITTWDSTEKGQSQLEEGDTAIGALLNGAADCDGYADAFYLLGNLAGLEVRYKVGNARTEFISSGVDGAHRWNLIRLEGQWYMVDVTWGDNEDGAPGEYDYQWLNLGTDRAALSHIWDANAAFVPLAERTDPSLFHFTRNDLQFFNLKDAAAAIYARGKAGERVLQVMLSGGAYTGDDDFVRSMRDNLTGGGEYTRSAQAVGEDWFVRIVWKEIR